MIDYAYAKQQSQAIAKGNWREIRFDVLLYAREYVCV